MPWKGKTVAQTRKEFVERVLNHEKTKAALCREYGISRPTGDKWLKRWKDGAEEFVRVRQRRRWERKHGKHEAK